jgi:hypothetical protein
MYFGGGDVDCGSGPAMTEQLTAEWAPTSSRRANEVPALHGVFDAAAWALSPSMDNPVYRWFVFISIRDKLTP